MRTLKKRVQTATASGRNWKSGINQFLLNYRASPHSTTGVAPARLLFNRDIKTKLPELPASRPVDIHHATARVNDDQRKAAIQKYTDAKRHTMPSLLAIYRRSGSFTDYSNRNNCQTKRRRFTTPRRTASHKKLVRW